MEAPRSPTIGLVLSREAIIGGSIVTSLGAGFVKVCKGGIWLLISPANDEVAFPTRGIIIPAEPWLECCCDDGIGACGNEPGNGTSIVSAPVTSSTGNRDGDDETICTPDCGSKWGLGE